MEGNYRKIGFEFGGEDLRKTIQREEREVRALKKRDYEQREVCVSLFKENIEREVENEGLNQLRGEKKRKRREREKMEGN